MDIQLNLYSGVYLKQNYCYTNDMLAIHYIGDIREWHKVCIKAIALNFIDAKGF